MNTPTNPAVPLTVEDVRKAGGIVHGDGNIFFSNIAQLNGAILAATAPVQPAQYDSSAQKLATAIAEAATKAGFTDASQHSLSGPQLLMLLDDLVGMATTSPLQEPPSRPYNTKRIAWELQRTAMGEGYFGSALRAAMDLGCVIPSDMTVLRRYATGVQSRTDHVALQKIAMKVYRHSIQLEIPMELLEQGVEASEAATKVASSKLETCDDCGAKVMSIIGCPDGANICQACFDAGNH